MFGKSLLKVLTLVLVVGCCSLGWAAEIDEEVTQGALRVKQEDGTIIECPLKHTDVKATISGFIARVVVTQTFHNPFKDKIEAVYVFPLPHKSAVDDMSMVIGDRRILGVIKRREVARQIYEQALAQGQTASLLEQERPNIFTQSVGNIASGQEVKIEISYVDVLEYDMGTYEFYFPMVVGPRYNASASFPGKTGGPNPDPATIIGSGPTTEPHGVNPSYLKPGFRNGHDIGLTVLLDSAVPLQDLKVTNHKVETANLDARRVNVTLSPEDSIPNKDFVMKYSVIGEKPEMAILSHKPYEEDGYFMLMIQPRLDEEMKKAPPREVVFLIDVSGSMSGEPTAKVQEIMRHFFTLTQPEDRVQVITFAGQAEKLFPASVPVTEENVTTALNFTQAIKAGGGTRMLEGIKAVLNEPPDPKRVRICVMLTDGYIGNEAEIIAEVGKRAGDKIRFWALGIGSSPNRFLIDGVAKQGGGMAKVVGPKDDPELLVREIVERIHRAQLSDISIDWGELDVYETYPTRIPELWAGRPVIVFGRYSGGGRQSIRIDGDVEGQPISYPLRVRFPRQEPENEVLSKVWARRKIEQLMDETYFGDAPEVVEEITQIALEYRLMSQFTSFVAVDETEIQSEEPVKPPRRVAVPVPLPEGVDYHGIFGPENEERDMVLYDAERIGVSYGMGYLARRKAPSDTGKGISLNDFVLRSPPRTERFGGSMDFYSSRGTKKVPYFGWNQTASVPSSAPAMAGVAMVHEQPARAGNFLYSRVASEESRENWFIQDTAAPVTSSDLKQGIQKTNDIFENAQKLEAEGKLREARSRYQMAYLLDRAIGSQPGMAEKVATALGKLQKTWTEKQVQKLAALDQKLNLVIRNISLQAALNEIGKAVGISIRLEPGAESDALQLVNRSALHVLYLDLRRVKVADALDSLLDPYSLIWQVDAKGNAVEVTSARRLSGQWPWVYEVSLLSTLTQEELGSDYKEAQLKGREAAEKFLEIIQSALPVSEDKKVCWLTSGQILLDGDQGDHGRMDVLLAYLRDEKTEVSLKISGEALNKLDELQKQTSKRYADRKERLEKQRTMQEQAEGISILGQSSWKLLSEAIKARLDLEALTELEYAFSNSPMAELSKENQRIETYRALWALSEASLALPDEKELKDFAGKTLVAQSNLLGDAVTRLRSNPEDALTFLHLLYSRLSVDNGIRQGWLEPEEWKDFLEQSASLLKRERQGLELRDLRLVASILIDPQGSPELGEVLKERLGEDLKGQDQVVLTALAAKRCGGEVWKQFRSQTKEILGEQPLPGAVVVLVHNLSANDLPVVLAKK